VSNIDLNTILFPDGDEQINEAVVRAWMDKMDRGETISMPRVLERRDGSIETFGRYSRHVVEAAKRLEATIRWYVLKEEECTPDQLAELRKAMDARPDLRTPADPPVGDN
jgi:hypothetical protein